jgi:hypothetical protein
VDRLLARGHGPAVYAYGWSWFTRCLRAAEAAEAAAAKRRRLERAGSMTDMRIAMHGDKDAYGRHFDALTRD